MRPANHRPHLVDPLWHGQRLRVLTHQPLAGFDPQIELQLLIDAVHAFVIPF